MVTVKRGSPSTAHHLLGSKSTGSRMCMCLCCLHRLHLCRQIAPLFAANKTVLIWTLKQEAWGISTDRPPHVINGSISLYNSQWPKGGIVCVIATCFWSFSLFDLISTRFVVSFAAQILLQSAHISLNDVHSVQSNAWWKCDLSIKLLVRC